MRILHTSDWHIGKRLMGRERLDEQSAALDEIVGICEREEVELVLVAGDIFDTYLPSAEAEDLFFSKIKAMAGEDRAVLLISGNHDDGVRLSAAAPLSEELGIYIVGNARKPLPINARRRVIPCVRARGSPYLKTTGVKKRSSTPCPTPTRRGSKKKNPICRLRNA